MRWLGAAVAALMLSSPAFSEGPRQPPPHVARPAAPVFPNQRPRPPPPVAHPSVPPPGGYRAPPAERVPAPQPLNEAGRLGEHDFEDWHRGHWEHRDHAGRFGWWWTVGGLWFSYAEPIYPAPDPVTPPVVVPPPDSSSYWYYCRSSEGYYPYVTECPEGWEPVVPPPADQ